MAGPGFDPSPGALYTGSALSYAISMQDARLIARLRRGEREALAGLQEEWRDAVWSVCSAMTSSEREAAALVQATWRSLREDTRGWSAHTPLCCQIAGLLCRLVAERLSLSQPDAEHVGPRFADRPVAGHEVSVVVQALPPATRLVFLLDLFFDCPVEVLAHQTGVPEPALRHARAVSLLRFVPQAGVDERAWANEIMLLPDLVADDLPAGEADALRAVVEADPGLDALADALTNARETCRAVLLSAPPAPAAPLERAAPAPLDAPGALGGVLLGLLAALASFVVALPPRTPPLAGEVAAHAAAVGQAPGFVVATEPGALRGALIAAGVPPALATAQDWSGLRMRLKGGLPAPEGVLGGVFVYGLDGRPVTIHEVPAPPNAGTPDESWEVRGRRLMAWQQGETGLVVLHEPVVGRTRVFASSMPVGQLLALLAWAIQSEA